MFLFSKLVVLSSSTLGTIGLSLYLIPLILRGNNSKINSLFKASESFYNSQNLVKFNEKEEKILNELNVLFNTFKRAVETSSLSRDLFKNQIEEFLDSTYKKEDILISLHKNNLVTLEKLSKLFEEISKLTESNLLLQEKIGMADYSNKLSESLEKILKSWHKSINEFVCSLDLQEYEDKEEKCKISQNGEAKPSEGGAVLLKRDQVVRMLEMH